MALTDWLEITADTIHRCNQPCVAKWFKEKEVYEDVFFAKDLKAVDKAQEFIDAFNALQLANTIHLNRPTVWTGDPGSRCATSWSMGHACTTVTFTQHAL